MLRFKFARFIGHLPYFPKQEFLLRGLYDPEDVFAGKHEALTCYAQVFGAYFKCNTKSFLEWGIAIKGGEERGLLKFLIEIAKREGFHQFFDIGANVGFFSIPISKFLETVSFEPHPRIFNSLKENIKLNPEISITPIRRAVSEKDCVGNIFLNENQPNLGLASLAVDPRLTNQNRKPVSLMKLDKHFPISGKKLLIKIDVEGHELAALRGMTKLLTSNKCLVYIETESIEVSEFMMKIGFSVNYLDHNLFRKPRFIPRPKTDGQIHILAANFKPPF